MESVEGQRNFLARVAGSLACAALLAACGASSSGDLFPGDGTDGGALVDPRPTGQTGSSSPGGSSGGSGSSSDAGADAGWTVEKDASAGGGDDGAAPSSDAGLLGCGLASTCGAPKTLGTVRGDTGNDVLALKGTGSEFIKVTVSEADSNLFTVPLSFTVTLSSPSSADFDLYVYPPGCDESAMYGESTNVGAGVTDRVTAGWPDNLGPDDSRDVIIQVRYNPASGGTCGLHPWTLGVAGNTTFRDD